MNATDILKYGQPTVLQTIDGFPESAWETPGACGVWSVKDIIAHLASYEQVLVDILTTFTNGGPTPTLNTYIELGGQFNDSEVSRRKEKTMQEVLAELNDAYAQTMSLIVKIPPETLRQAGTLPWYGMDYSLDDVIVYMYYGHKREHSAQIAAFRDRLSMGL
jgi:DinB superfamily